MSHLPRGRFAPSPTGELHLGNASTALLAWLSIRSRNGSFVMRMEDLDRARVRPQLAEQILDDLSWFGIDWDEGPDLGGPQAPYTQTECGHRYAAAFDELNDAGRLYPCFCSRRDVAAAASAPQDPGDEVRYPGLCRQLDISQALERVAAGERHSWRIRVERDELFPFNDLVRGVRCPEDAPGDFVVRRSDGVPSYHLAVVVDDAVMGIDEVVRGGDLIASTARQLLLFAALGKTAPVFGHVPLLLGTDEIRLSKRHKGVTLRELRGSGLTAEQIIGQLAHLLGLRPDARPVAAGDLIEGFDLNRLNRVASEIVIDVGSL